MKTRAFTKSFGGKTVLRVPAIEFESGTVYAVLGANGSGKSTFARVISGVLECDDRRDVADGSTIGYMPQKSYGFRMSALKNVCLTGGGREEAARMMEELGIGYLKKARANRLSGGETARMALARILMGSYDVVILDEPTASMDIESTILSEKLALRCAKERGSVLIWVTHSLQQARRIADKVLYMHKGELKEIGPADTVLYEPKSSEMRDFLEFYKVDT